MRIADEVRESHAVVALETTLVAHGFPPGEGVAVGLESERQVREAGAVPATIGVLDGEIVVGLTAAELERFGADARPNVYFAGSRRPVAVRQVNHRGGRLVERLAQ